MTEQKYRKPLMTCGTNPGSPNTILLQWAAAGRESYLSHCYFGLLWLTVEGNSLQVSSWLWWCYGSFSSSNPRWHHPPAHKRIPGRHLRPQSCSPWCQECSQWTLTQLPAWTLGQSVSSQQVLPVNVSQRWEGNTGSELPEEPRALRELSDVPSECPRGITFSCIYTSHHIPQGPLTIYQFLYPPGPLPALHQPSICCW